MLIRRARASDIAGIARLDRQLLEYEARLDPELMPLPEKKLAAYVRKKLRGREAAAFVAEEDGRLVGYCLGEVQRRPFFRSKAGYYHDCFVLPGRRQRGVATALTRRLLEWFRQRGVRLVKLDAYSNNKPALAAWRRLGFRESIKELRLFID